MRAALPVVLVALTRATAANAAEPQPARALVGTALLERVVRAELPLRVSASDAPTMGTLFVLDVRYCGPDATGRARALAVLAPTDRVPAGGALRANDDCRAALETLAQRVLPAAGKSAAVVELTATARARDLLFAIEKVAVAGERSAPGAERLRALSARPRLPPVTTGGLEVGAGGSNQERFSVGFDWRRDGIALAAIPGVRAPSARGGRERPAESGLSVELPLELINTLVAARLAREPFRVRLDPEEIELTGLRIARSGGRLVVTGRATPRSVRQSFDLAVDLDGADLQVADVRVDAGLEDCSALGLLQRLGCSTRNAGRSGAAQALAAGLRRRYRGHQVRALIGPQELRLDLGGQPLVLRAELVRVTARESAVDADASATVGPTR